MNHISLFMQFGVGFGFSNGLSNSIHNSEEDNGKSSKTTEKLIQFLFFYFVLLKENGFVFIVSSRTSSVKIGNLNNRK